MNWTAFWIVFLPVPTIRFAFWVVPGIDTFLKQYVSEQTSSFIILMIGVFIVALLVGFFRSREIEDEY